MPDRFCNFHFSRAPLLLFTISIFVTALFAVEIPLDFHGRGMVSKYLNAHSARYNMDAIIELYCTVVKLDDFAFYLNYRDDLDMALQSGGVSFDPRFAHYYMAGGFDYFLRSYFARFYFVHDCVHDIDSLVPGTPVFNRFRLQFGDGDFHYSRWPEPARRFIWSLSLGVYPHFPYHGWDINAGADYNFETIMEVNINLFKNRFFAADLNPKFHFIMGDTCLYQQHLTRLLFYYHHYGKRFGVSFDYNLKNNDPIKNPDKLWLLSTYIEF
jgi:hypothetical protein